MNYLIVLFSTLLSVHLFAVNVTNGTESSTVLQQVSVSSVVPVAVAINDSAIENLHHRHHHGEPDTSKPENQTGLVDEKNVNETKDVVEIEVNYAPTIAKRIQKIAITAGKVLNFTVPKTTFSDREDGHNLTIELRNAENERLTENSWIQFDGHHLSALPLEEHVSKWNFIITATDSGNKTVKDDLEIIVRQDKTYRSVSHEFQLDFDLNTNNFLQTKIKLLNAIGDFVGGHRSPHADLTVRQASKSIGILPSNITFEKIRFVWSNDSLARDKCPKREIETILQRFSPQFDGLLGDEFRARLLEFDLNVQNGRVRWKGLNQCANFDQFPAETIANKNYSPVLRNSIDKIDAVEGQLLVFKVPFDTFFDREDGDTQNMQLQLLNKDREILKSNNWLQFDTKNQEIFGLPLNENIGPHELFLQCTDRGNLTSFDALVLQVNAVANINFNTKFIATLSMSYENFSTIVKRTFIETIMATISPQLDHSIIHVLDIYQNPTITFVWFNASLPSDYCATHDINAIKSRFFDRQSGLYSQKMIHSGQTDNIPFAIDSIDIEFIGNCKTLEAVISDSNAVESDYDISLKQDGGNGGLAGGNTNNDNDDDDIYKDILSRPDDDSYANGISKIAHQEYFLTFLLPVMLIVSALMISFCLACFLIRKRNRLLSDKTNVLANLNTNGGVPIIFQDEMIEDPHQDTASVPIIFDQEKPPLTPPKLFSNRAAFGRDYAIKSQSNVKNLPPPYR